MANITLRKNTPLGLTNEQVDNNFTSLNDGILQVAGTNLYPDFDLKDSSFYTGDSGATFSIIPNVLTTSSGRINYLRSDTTTKNVYTGWFKIEPNKDYTFSSLGKIGQANAATIKVSVEFATVTDYTTNTFVVSTKTEVGSTALATDTVLSKQIKSGVADRRARFVIEHLNQTTSTSVFAGAFKCELQASSFLTSPNNIFPNPYFTNKSLAGWYSTGNVSVVTKTELTGSADASTVSQNMLTENFVKLAGGSANVLYSHASPQNISDGVFAFDGEKFIVDYYVGQGALNTGGSLFVYLNQLKSDGTTTKTVIDSFAIGSVEGVTHKTTTFSVSGDSKFIISFETNMQKNIYLSRLHLKKLSLASDMGDGSITVTKFSTGVYGGLPLDNDTRSAGTSTSLSRADHVHNRDAYLGGLKNQIINGGFDFWQRGTSQTTTGYGSADRWKLVTGGSGFTYKMSKDTVTAPYTNLSFFARNCAKISISGMTAGTGKLQLVQPMEDVRRFYNKKLVVSFWAKSSLASKSISVNISSPHSDAVFQSSLNANNFSLTTDWVKYNVLFNPSTTALSGNNVQLPLTRESSDSPTFLNLIFNLSSGVWTDASFLNNCDIFISQVQLEYGNSMTDYEWRHPELEERLCKRYFEFMNCPINGMVVSLNDARTNFRYTVPKRGIPAITVRTDLLMVAPIIYSQNGVGEVVGLVPRIFSEIGIDEMTLETSIALARSYFSTEEIPLYIDAEI